jgi:hypothetical protein
MITASLRASATLARLAKTASGSGAAVLAAPAERQVLPEGLNRSRGRGAAAWGDAGAISVAQ